jgi:iron complex outermembrane receptor protein
MAGAKLADWLRWDANISLSQHKILNFTEQDVDVYDADWNWTSAVSKDLGTTNIAMSPNVVFNNLFSLNYKRIEFALASSYVGKQYLDNTSDEDRSMPAYFFSNITASYSLVLPKMKSLDFKLQVNNLFDAKYVTNGYVWYSYYLDGKRENELRYFPQAGIHYLASVSLKF